MSDMVCKLATPSQEEEHWVPVFGEWTGLRVPPGVTSTWSGRGFEDLTVNCSLGKEKYEVHGLSLRNAEGAEPVTATRLRALPLQTLSDAAAGKAVNWSGRAPRTFRNEVTKARQAAPDARGPSLLQLGLAAALFRYGGLLGEAPAELVSQEFSVSISTAGNWIRRAKDLGYLDPNRPMETAPRSLFVSYRRGVTGDGR